MDFKYLQAQSSLNKQTNMHLIRDLEVEQPAAIVRV